MNTFNTIIIRPCNERISLTNFKWWWCSPPYWLPLNDFDSTLLHNSHNLNSSNNTQQSDGHHIHLGAVSKKYFLSKSMFIVTDKDPSHLYVFHIVKNIIAFTHRRVCWTSSAKSENRNTAEKHEDPDDDEAVELNAILQKHQTTSRYKQDKPLTHGAPSIYHSILVNQHPLREPSLPKNSKKLTDKIKWTFDLGRKC